MYFTRYIYRTVTTTATRIVARLHFCSLTLPFPGFFHARTHVRLEVSYIRRSHCELSTWYLVPEP